MIKKVNINGIVAYNRKKRRTRRDIDEVAHEIDKHKSKGE